MLIKASFVFLCVVSLAAAATNGSHHLTIGTRLPGDYLLSQQVVTKSSSFLRIVTKDIAFVTPYRQTITQVKALDQKTNGNGAFASITKGGPGNQNVNVHFESQRGHGVSFLLEIYGR